MNEKSSCPVLRGLGRSNAPRLPGGYPPFAPGKDGFPRTGEVVKYYRGQKMDEKGKAWTQRNLAWVLNMTEQAIRDMENRDASMDMERRRFLCNLLDIPPVLFGIVTLEEILKMVEQRRAAEVVTQVVSTPTTTSPKLVINVEEYTTLLTDSWTTFISDPAHLSITDVSSRIDALYHELPHAREKKPIAELLCRYHDFVANVWCDQQKYDVAFEHFNKALRFAEQSNKDELIVFVLYDWGYTLRQADRFDEAVQKYEEARRYEQALPKNLRGALLLDAGCAGALAAKTPEKKREAIALVDRVGNIVRSKEMEEDPFFLNLNQDRYHLTRCVSLIAVGRNKDAINELRLVKAGPEHPRRQAFNYIHEAQARVNLGEYEWTVELAEAGLVIAQKINSEANIARVEKICRQLKKSPYKHNPDVGRLDYLLRKK